MSRRPGLGSRRPSAGPGPAASRTPRPAPRPAASPAGPGRSPNPASGGDGGGGGGGRSGSRVPLRTPFRGRRPRPASPPGPTAAAAAAAAAQDGDSEPHCSAAGSAPAPSAPHPEAPGGAPAPSARSRGGRQRRPRPGTGRRRRRRRRPGRWGSRCRRRSRPSAPSLRSSGRSLSRRLPGRLPRCLPGACGRCPAAAAPGASPALPAPDRRETRGGWGTPPAPPHRRVLPLPTGPALPPAAVPSRPLRPAGGNGDGTTGGRGLGADAPPPRARTGPGALPGSPVRVPGQAGGRRAGPVLASSPGSGLWGTGVGGTRLAPPAWKPVGGPGSPLSAYRSRRVDSSSVPGCPGLPWD